MRELRSERVGGLHGAGGHTRRLLVPGMHLREHVPGGDGLATLHLTHDADGGLLILLQAVDISERKVLEARLQHLADHDALTGLYTRRRFEEELAREISRSRRRH